MIAPGLMTFYARSIGAADKIMHSTDSCARQPSKAETHYSALISPDPVSRQQLAAMTTPSQFRAKRSQLRVNLSDLDSVADNLGKATTREQGAAIHKPRIATCKSRDLDRTAPSPSESCAAPGSRTDVWSLPDKSKNEAQDAVDFDRWLLSESMMSQRPKKNTTHDLAFFLRTTGPAAPHQEAIKVEGTGAGRAKPALRLPKLFRRQSASFSASTFCQRPNSSPYDEGGLLAPLDPKHLPTSVKQEVSSKGKRYLALQIPGQSLGESEERHSETLSSPTSTRYASHSTSPDELVEWLSELNELDAPVETDHHRHVRLNVDEEVSYADRAICPPETLTPAVFQPYSISSLSVQSEHYAGDDESRTTRDPSPLARIVLAARPKHSANGSAPIKAFELKHPAPRHFASHPLLGQSGSDECTGSTSSSPDLPLRSPLRLQKSSERVESGPNQLRLAKGCAQKVAPSFAARKERSLEDVPIARNGTEYTVPTKKQEAMYRGGLSRPRYGTSSEEQDARSPLECDSSVQHPSNASVTKTSIPASTAIQQKLVPSASALSQDTLVISPPDGTDDESSRAITGPPHEAAALTSPWMQEVFGDCNHQNVHEKSKCWQDLQMSPITLIAEHDPEFDLLRETAESCRVYMPSPRSGLVLRDPPANRRSTSSAIFSPVPDNREDPAALPVASLPPKKALPPTPPLSDSGRHCGERSAQHKSSSETCSSSSSAVKRTDRSQHVVLQAAKKKSRFDTRLDALEKQNALLSAALMAVLKTNGALNNPAHFQDYSGSADGVPHREASADRCAQNDSDMRKKPNGCDGSAGSANALNMYMNTRNNSRSA